MEFADPSTAERRRASLLRVEQDFLLAMKQMLKLLD
jgi:hypothetical protein